MYIDCIINYYKTVTTGNGTKFSYKSEKHDVNMNDRPKLCKCAVQTVQ